MLAYFVPYDPSSWASFEAHASMIDIVATQWVTLDACGGLTSSDDQTLKQFAHLHGVRVFPSLLTNAGWLNHTLLTDPEISTRSINQIVDYLTSEGYDGFDLDLEAVRPDDREAYTAFVARLGATLHQRGKALSLALPAKVSDATTGWGGAFDYAALAPHADLVTIMAYEFHGAWGEPGAIAPYDWVERVLAFATSQIPPDRVLLGLGFYGYDWNTTSGGAHYLGFSEASALASRQGATLSQDSVTHSATFPYQAPGSAQPVSLPRPPVPDHIITQRTPPPCELTEPNPQPTPNPRPAPPQNSLQSHEVWIETAANGADRMGLAARYHTAGIATWCLGLEDPLIWEAINQWRQLAATEAPPGVER